MLSKVVKRGKGWRKGRVVVSFEMASLTKRQSFPRKRESTPQAFGNTPDLNNLLHAAWKAR
jgi:hypothetical protein